MACMVETKTLLDAEALVDGREREDEADDGAVGVGDDVAAGLVAPGLVLDEVEVVGVDLGDDEGNVGGHAEGAGVRDDGAAGGGELWLELAGDVGVEGGEDDLRQLADDQLRGVGLDGHGRDVRRHRGVELPAAGLAVGFAGAAITGGEPGDLKPGMVAEELDESLADRAGRAENAYLAPLHIPSSIAREWVGGSVGWGTGWGTCRKVNGLALVDARMARDEWRSRRLDLYLRSRDPRRSLR